MAWSCKRRKATLQRRPSRPIYRNPAPLRVSSTSMCRNSSVVSGIKLQRLTYLQLSYYDPGLQRHPGIPVEDSICEPNGLCAFQFGIQHGHASVRMAQAQPEERRGGSSLHGSPTYGSAKYLGGPDAHAVVRDVREGRPTRQSHDVRRRCWPSASMHSAPQVPSSPPGSHRRRGSSIGSGHDHKPRPAQRPQHCSSTSQLHGKTTNQGSQSLLSPECHSQLYVLCSALSS